MELDVGKKELQVLYIRPFKIYICSIVYYTLNGLPSTLVHLDKRLSSPGRIQSLACGISYKSIMSDDNHSGWKILSVL